MPENHNPGWNAYAAGATVLGGDGQVIDELPDDEDTVLEDGEWEFLAMFDAYIGGSQIFQGGELQLRVRVPYEHKYKAMPLTDMRGITFKMFVYRPVPKGERNGQGNKSGGGSYANGATGNGDGQFLDDPFALSSDDG